MAIQKFYISWREFVANRSWRTHPDDFFKVNYPAITFTALGYKGNGNDTRHMAKIEYDDTVFSSEDYDGMMAHGVIFNLFELTNNEVPNILNEWYPPAEGDSDYFSLDVNDDIVDNRPEPELI